MNWQIIAFTIGMMLQLATSALASDQEVRCEAVQTLAIISADERLIVSQVKDPIKKTCHFYVNMPPAEVAENTLQSSAQLLSQIIGGADPEAAAKAWGASTSSAMASLVSQSNFSGDFVKAYVDAISAQQPAIAECAFKLSLSNEGLTAWNEVVSCGKSPTGNSFIVETKFNSVSVSLYFLCDCIVQSMFGGNLNQGRHTAKAFFSWLWNGLGGDIRSSFVGAAVGVGFASLGTWWTDPGPPREVELLVSQGGFAIPMAPLLESVRLDNARTDFTFVPPDFEKVFVCEYSHLTGYSGREMMLNYLSKYSMCFAVSQVTAHKYRISPRYSSNAELKHTASGWYCNCN